MKKSLTIGCLILLAIQTLEVKAWDVDFSRRQKRQVPINSLDQVNQGSNPSNDPLKEEAPMQSEGRVETRAPRIVAQKLPSSDVSAASQDQNSNDSEAKTHYKTEIPNFGSKDSTTTVPSRLEGIVKRVVTPGSGSSDRQEFVILNTAHGFIPSNVRLHKGLHYTVHVVNVNDEKKNVSFMLDAFGEHHATYFGKIKSFDLDPDKEGIFEFQCPETSAQGKFVIFGNQLKIERRVSSSP